MPVFYSFLFALIDVRPPFDPLIKRLLKIGNPNFLAINVFIFYDPFEFSTTKLTSALVGRATEVEYKEYKTIEK